MNLAGHAESRFLSAIGSHRESMIQFASRLRTHEQVATVTTGLDVRAYETAGARLESYVEATMRDGTCLCWWLELRWEGDRWLIDADLLRNGDEGRSVVRNLAERTARVLPELTEELAAATRELVSTRPGADPST